MYSEAQCRTGPPAKHFSSSMGAFRIQRDRGCENYRTSMFCYELAEHELLLWSYGLNVIEGWADLYEKKADLLWRLGDFVIGGGNSFNCLCFWAEFGRWCCIWVCVSAFPCFMRRIFSCVGDLSAAVKESHPDKKEGPSKVWSRKLALCSECSYRLFEVLLFGIIRESKSSSIVSL